jgi:hypothetical protein
LAPIFFTIDRTSEAASPQLILEMIGKAANTAEANYQQAVETSRKLSVNFERPKIGYESLR